MRKNLLVAALLMFIILIIPGLVLAQDFGDRIRHQQERIDRGIRAGELTRGEADILQDNLNWIRDRYARMRADRMLTNDERARLDRMLDENGRMIQNRRNNPARRLYTRGDFLERIREQQGKIDQGVRSGELTRGEADTLQDNLNRIRDRFNRMKADGRLDAAEQARLDRYLDENILMIYDKKKNPVRRFERFD